jgi:CubicO group peptidase (beta-lactamase class C family)
MKKSTVVIILVSALTLLTFGSREGMIEYSSLEQSIDSLLAPGDVVGFSACIIKDGRIAWTMNRGMADLENSIPVTDNTIFQLASLSKTVTGAALMYLFDNGKFLLDDDVNKYIPFEIRNPNFPDQAISIRMLLTHTSSLNDVRPYINKLYGSGDQRSVPFGEIIKNCFNPEGSYYSSENFLNAKPGEKWRYCNLNYVLIAFLVEQISRESFPDYTRKNLYGPLEMNETGWFYSDFDTTHIAVQYENDPLDVAKKVRVPQYSWPGYPDGSLKTSIIQFANFIIMLCNEGYFNDKQILKPETVSEILKPQNVKMPPIKIVPPMLDMGLTWMVTDGDSIRYFMHGGEGSGITTLAFFNPNTKTGAIIFLTGQYLREDGEFAQNPKRYSSLLFELFSKYLK